ncbi:hypothetical protein HDU76_012555 [Blyttiomyces sp. JEL0837]|nr:hypothetical protein HDU76_012555 [Blyttiomyces sp. JEL0837]
MLKVFDSLWKSSSSGQGPSLDSQDQTVDSTLCNTVFVKKIIDDELIEVELTRGDSVNRMMDLDAFRDVCASKLNLIRSSLQIYDAGDSNLILLDAHFQSAIKQGTQNGTAAVFVCDGTVDSLSSTVGSVIDHPPCAASAVNEGDGVLNGQGFLSSQTTVEFKKVSVTVDHTEIKKPTKIQVDALMTFHDFKNKISTNMRLDPASITIFYMESEYQVEVIDDESF